MEMLYQVMNRKELRERKIYLSCEIIERESVKAI
jgi:DNA-binding LacI/PurR family transcriptional regulator